MTGSFAEVTGSPLAHEDFDAIIFDAGGILVLPDPTVLAPLLAPYGGSTSIDDHALRCQRREAQHIGQLDRHVSVARAAGLIHRTSAQHSQNGNAAGKPRRQGSGNLTATHGLTHRVPQPERQRRPAPSRPLLRTSGPRRPAPLPIARNGLDSKSRRS